MDPPAYNAAQAPGYPSYQQGYAAGQVPPQGQPYAAGQVPPQGQPYAAGQVPPQGQSYAAGQVPPQGQIYAAGQVPPQGQPYAAGQVPPQGQPYAAGQVPPTTTVVTTNAIVVGTGGSCPSCGIGYITDDYTICGILLAIVFFPIGILCCLALKDKKCSHCGRTF